MRKKVHEMERVLEVTAQHKDPLDFSNVDHLDFRYHGSSGTSEITITTNYHQAQDRTCEENRER